MLLLQDNALFHTAGVAIANAENCDLELLSDLFDSADIATSKILQFPKRQSQLRGGSAWMGRATPYSLIRLRCVIIVGLSALTRRTILKNTEKQT